MVGDIDLHIICKTESWTNKNIPDPEIGVT